MWLRLLLSFVGAFIFGVKAMPYRVPLQGLVGGTKTLVLLDDLSGKDRFSLFFDSLVKRGHALTYLHGEAPDVKLVRYGEQLFDNVLLIGPSIEEMNTITFDDLLLFMERGGNVLVATDETVNDNQRKFLNKCGIDLHSGGGSVKDHFHFISELDTRKDHTAVLASPSLETGPILRPYPSSAPLGPVVFRGIAHSLSGTSILAIPVLTAQSTGYSSTATSAAIEAAATGAVLVSAIQARNNARFGFAGSLDLLSNSFISAPLPQHLVNTTTNNASIGSAGMNGNLEFLTRWSSWVFGETGVLRFRDVRHHKADGSPPHVILTEKERPDLPVTLYPDPEISRNSLVYRIKDQIVYSLALEQFVASASPSNDNLDQCNEVFSSDELQCVASKAANNNSGSGVGTGSALVEDRGRAGSWQPLCVSDMQLEFVMLDAHVRKTMHCNPSTNRMEVSFMAPDNYGIFKFRVLYRRLGWSVIHSEDQVSLRPFKHNEYERFIYAAYPYYSSALSALLAFTLFCGMFLFAKV